MLDEEEVGLLFVPLTTFSKLFLMTTSSPSSTKIRIGEEEGLETEDDDGDVGEKDVGEEKVGEEKVGVMTWS